MTENQIVANHDKNKERKKWTKNLNGEAPTQTRLPSGVASSVVRDIYLIPWGTRVTNILWCGLNTRRVWKHKH